MTDPELISIIQQAATPPAYGLWITHHDFGQVVRSVIGTTITELRRIKDERLKQERARQDAHAKESMR